MSDTGKVKEIRQAEIFGESEVENQKETREVHNNFTSSLAPQTSPSPQVPKTRAERIISEVSQHFPILNSDRGWQETKELATIAVMSGFYQVNGQRPLTFYEAFVIMSLGKDLKLNPFVAMKEIAVVEGKPTMSAALMKALVHQRIPGSEIIFTESTDSLCRATVRRFHKDKEQVFEYSIEEAKKAGLLISRSGKAKVNWQRFPADMLRARLISRVVRAVFSDALMGAWYDADELGFDTDRNLRSIEPLESQTENFAGMLNGKLKDVQSED